LTKHPQDPVAGVDRSDGTHHSMPYLDRAGDESIGLHLPLHCHDLPHTQVLAGDGTIVEQHGLVLPVIDLDPVHPDATEGPDGTDDSRAPDAAPAPRRLVSGAPDPRASVVHRVAGSPKASTRVGLSGRGGGGDEGEKQSQNETFDHGSTLRDGGSGTSGAA
jgi:hypothetical protein